MGRATEAAVTPRRTRRRTIAAGLTITATVLAVVAWRVVTGDRGGTADRPTGWFEINQRTAAVDIEVSEVVPPSITLTIRNSQAWPLVVVDPSSAATVDQGNSGLADAPGLADVLVRDWRATPMDDGREV